MAEDETSAAGKPASVDKQLIREMADLLDETGLTEIEVEHDGRRIRVARGVNHDHPHYRRRASMSIASRHDRRPIIVRRRGPRTLSSTPAPSPRQWSAPPTARLSQGFPPSSRSAPR